MATVIRLHDQRIERSIDECECDHCGSPLLVGDRVYYDLAQGAAYCAVSCAERDCFHGTGPRVARWAD
jgi:hypothetical protein